MAVLSFAVSLEVLVSPPPETVTVFITEAGALLVTFTVRVIAGWLAPAASVSLRVQPSVGAVVQDQPVPAMAAAVKPVGRASVTVTVPEVAAPPLFVTVIA